MPSLREMVGQSITALVPMIDNVKLQELKLHGVEDGGVWVESQYLINVLLSSLGVAAAPKTVIFFLPFHQISFVLGSLNVPALSEKGLGV
jgi:hypothetical protein